MVAQSHDSLQVAFVGDAGVIEPIAVAAHSVVRATVHADAGVHIVAVDWSEADHRRARQLIPGWVNIVDTTSARLPKVRAGRHVTSATYALLLLPELLDDLDRVIYLDADVMVRNSRIDDLWEIDLEGYSVAGVSAIRQSRVGDADGIVGWRSLGLNPRAPMLNSGVLVLDLDQIRSSGLFGRALDYALGHSQVTHLADQHALNAALNGQWLRLLPIYNCNYRQLTDTSGAAVVFDDAEVSAALHDPVIVHFVGEQKPWLQIPEDGFVHEWRSIAATLGIVSFAPYRTGPTRRDLEQRIAQLERQCRDRDERLARIRASRSYRVGSALARPARMLRRWLGAAPRQRSADSRD